MFWQYLVLILQCVAEGNMPNVMEQSRQPYRLYIRVVLLQPERGENLCRLMKKLNTVCGTNYSGLYQKEQHSGGWFCRCRLPTILH